MYPTSIAQTKNQAAGPPLLGGERFLLPFHRLEKEGAAGNLKQ
jgi:hypothetical protein